MSRDYLTPPAIAERLGIKAARVVEFIRTGELPAMDVSRRGSTRPRFKVSESDFQVFEARRRVQSRAAANQVRRKQTAGNVIQFF